MALEVGVARSGSDLEQVYRLRYAVFVEEMGLPLPGADPAGRFLMDAFDDCATNYLLRDAGRVVGTLRAHRLVDLPDSSLAVRHYAAQPAVEAFGIAAIGLTGRFALAPAARHGRAIQLLLDAALADAQASRIRVSYGDCAPALQPLYEYLGYRRYQPAVYHPSWGFLLPLLLLVGDRERFAAVRSPLASLASGYPDDAEARTWFVRTYPDYVESAPPRPLPEGDFLDLLAHQLNADPLHGLALVQGLTRSEARRVLALATTIHVARGEHLIRQGNPGRGLYVLVAGGAEVLLDEAPGRPISVLGVGDVFGEVSLLTAGERTANVVALTPCDVLVISGDVFANFVEQQPAIAAKVLFNLARVLAHRLAETTRRMAAGL